MLLPENRQGVYFPVDHEMGTGVVNARRKGFKVRILIVIAVALLVIAIVLVVVFALAYFSRNKSSSAAFPSEPYIYPTRVTVYFAASLLYMMDSYIFPNYSASHNVYVIENAAGSSSLANLLKNGSSADVFISADSAINLDLMNTTLPHSPAKVASWYLPLARTRLGIAYSHKSSFAPMFEAVINNETVWYQVLKNSTMKLGRTDPELDPKGYRTVIMMRLAEIYYNVSNLESSILGSSRNSAQIYSEQTLEKLLSNGSLDAAFFYDCEQKWGANSTFISLPDHIDMSNKALNSYYAQANYTSDSTGKVRFGSAVVYTLTIPTSATHLNDSIMLSKYIIDQTKTSLFTYEGLFAVENRSFVGNTSTIPPELLIYPL